jgi:Cft2 family RNA processing exonuclease
MDRVHEPGGILVSVNGAFGRGREAEKQGKKQGKQQKFMITPHRIRVHSPSTAFTIKYIKRQPYYSIPFSRIARLSKFIIIPAFAAWLFLYS